MPIKAFRRNFGWHETLAGRNFFGARGTAAALFRLEIKDDDDDVEDGIALAYDWIREEGIISISKCSVMPSDQRACSSGRSFSPIVEGRSRSLCWNRLTEVVKRQGDQRRVESV